MVPYYCNEALLVLPSVQSLTDRTRHHLEIVTEEGAKLDLVIARLRTTPEESLRETIEKGLADQSRSLSGFQLVSKAEGEYGGLHGIETKVRFVDKQKGAMFHYAFHTVVESDRVGFFGISSVADAAACDAWMVSMLSNLKPRA
jgi:hypothetical protein